MAQVTSYQRGSLTFTTSQQTNNTGQTVFTNSSSAPMRVINVGCVSWNLAGNESRMALGFFVRHNASATYATTAMLAMVANGNGTGGVELPPGNTTGMRGALVESSNSYPGSDAIVFGTMGSADPIGATNTGHWISSAAWWLMGDRGGRTFNSSSTSYVGNITHSPGGFWMSPGDSLVAKAWFGPAGTTTASNTCYVAYNFITVTDSGS